MIISQARTRVLGIKLTDWLIENESCPRKEIKDFLRRLYEGQAGEALKPRKGGDDAPADQSANLRTWLLEAVYDHFSISESGDVLLVSGDWVPDDEDPNPDDDESLLLTGEDAKELIALLKEKLQVRMRKIQALVS